jgi:RHS repeat-associated protein
LVANQAGQAVWRWDQQEPFGNNPADENPSGLGTFDLPLRLPGQYSDKETNLHYNYFRDFDPSLGRYAQSDPLGLSGGINTYLYANAVPLLAIDPFGLEWVFVRWEYKEHRGWWAHWADLLAVCYETCTKIMNKVSALFQQWRPMGINTTPVPSYDPFGSSPTLTNALFDLAEAMQKARNEGSKSKQQLITENPQAGNAAREKLPLPPGAQGKCCPDTR